MKKRRRIQRREESLSRESIIAASIALLDSGGEAALTFRDHQPLGDQAAEQFPQRADACAVILAHPLQPELRTRQQLAEDNVSADEPIGLLAHRIVVWCPVQHRISVETLVGARKEAPFYL